jgi:hypothetical protein
MRETSLKELIEKLQQSEEDPKDWQRAATVRESFSRLLRVSDASRDARDNIIRRR